MKLALLAAITAACTPAPAPPAPRGPDAAALEARIAALEHQLAQRTPQPNVVELGQRVDELETLARETHALQQDIQALVSRLAERAAASAPPVAATPRSEQLDPQRRYRIPLGDSAAFGPADAPVTLVAAVQLPERFTHELWPALRALRAKYGTDLRFVVQAFVANPPALATTVAACAVAAQGPGGLEALDKLEDALWTARELAQTDASKPWPDAEDARAAASGAGVDLKAYDARVIDCTKRVDREQRALAAAGQTAAPTLWINGRPIVGAQSADRLAGVIDEELARARADRERGGAARTYYDRLMRAAAPTPK